MKAVVTKDYMFEALFVLKQINAFEDSLDADGELEETEIGVRNRKLRNIAIEQINRMVHNQNIPSIQIDLGDDVNIFRDMIEDHINALLKLKHSIINIW